MASALNNRFDPYYRYTTLPEGSIRLLKILPTCSPTRDLDESQDEPLSTPTSGLEKEVEIDLDVFPLASCPAYTALSYTWGPSGSLSDQTDEIFTQVASCFPIICNRRIILGTKSLRDAMRYIRCGIDTTFRAQGLTEEQQAHARYLFQDVPYFWIDAVCIDQSNVLERNHQVRLMSQIYRRAHKTFIWLGKKDDLSDTGTAVLSKVLANVTYAQEEADRRGGEGVEVEPLNLSPTQRRACATLLSRNWFSRYWILQEALLSREAIVLIGTRVTTFMAYERTRTLAQMAGFAVPEMGDASKFADIRPKLKAQETIATLTFMEQCRDEICRGCLPSFMTVMDMCRVQECFDPRDRIYSLLGLCREFTVDERLLIEPDYSKSVEQVFLEATVLIINTRQDLAILNLVRRDANPHGLPSWCPDYRDIRATLVASVYQDNARPWRLPNLPPHTLSVTSQYLTTYGRRAGVIQEMAELLKPLNPEELDHGLAYGGIRGILSLLTRLKTEDDTITGRMQTLGRVDLLWHTVTSTMFSCFHLLANWTVRPLPNGSRLLLPQLIRTLASIGEAMDDPRPDAEEFYIGIVRLEAIIEELINLEPEKAHFLPTHNEYSESFDPDAEDVAVDLSFKGLLRSRDDHEQLREKATELGLSLPPEFTSKPVVDLYNDRYSDFYLNQAYNWFTGFSNGLSRLSGAVLFRTDKQTLGMAKCDPQVDDEIWILDGAYAPICLRPSANGNYRFLGEVYIHEIMDGEAVQACTEPVRVVIE